MQRLYYTFLLLFLCVSVQAQQLTIGGYGEAAFTRNFFSDNVYRYSRPAEYANDPSHDRFDIPHAVIYIGYDFGKGWSLQTEVEFEHTGTGSAVEKEFTEAGEWESEIEQGGEVELEQFWLQKSFCPEFNVRAGHIVVPVGGLNNAPYKKSPVGQQAVAAGMEAGYDIAPWFNVSDSPFYLFARYELFHMDKYAI